MRKRETRKEVLKIKALLHRRGEETAPEHTIDLSADAKLEKKDRFALSLAGILAVLPIAAIFLAAYFFLLLLLVKLWMGG